MLVDYSDSEEETTTAPDRGAMPAKPSASRDLKHLPPVQNKTKIDLRNVKLPLLMDSDDEESLEDEEEEDDDEVEKDEDDKASAVVVEPPTNAISNQTDKDNDDDDDDAYRLSNIAPTLAPRSGHETSSTSVSATMTTSHGEVPEAKRQKLTDANIRSMLASGQLPSVEFATTVDTGALRKNAAEEFVRAASNLPTGRRAETEAAARFKGLAWRGGEVQNATGMGGNKYQITTLAKRALELKAKRAEEGL